MHHIFVRLKYVRLFHQFIACCEARLVLAYTCVLLLRFHRLFVTSKGMSSDAPAAPVPHVVSAQGGHTATFGEIAASADPQAFQAAVQAAPPLSEIRKPEAALIEAQAMKAHAGTIEKGSFASMAMSAAERNERHLVAPHLTAASTGPQETSTTVLGDVSNDAAAAQADQFEAVRATLKGTAYDLDTITRRDLQQLESAAARANGGIIEKHSYVARAQVLSEQSAIHTHVQAIY
jgi:hypothetical protein